MKFTSLAVNDLKDALSVERGHRLAIEVKLQKKILRLQKLKHQLALIRYDQQLTGIRLPSNADGERKQELSSSDEDSSSDDSKAD
jgi:hypothetical protein